MASPIACTIATASFFHEVDEGEEPAVAVVATGSSSVGVGAGWGVGGFLGGGRHLSSFSSPVSPRYRPADHGRTPLPGWGHDHRAIRLLRLKYPHNHVQAVAHIPSKCPQRWWGFGLFWLFLAVAPLLGVWGPENRSLEISMKLNGGGYSCLFYA